jgi:hypothetical protein
VTVTVKAQPVISSISTSPGSFANKPLYGKFEIGFSMGTYSNPYDPSIIQASCQFTGPGGTFVVPAFYYSGYTKTNNTNCTPFPCEVLTTNNFNNWKVRFTPNAVGQWSYQITATDANGVTTSAVYYFTVVNSSNKGFIVKANDKFLKRSTGQFLFLVGENIAWYDYNQGEWHSPNSFGTNEYKNYIDDIAANGGNFIRVWLDMYATWNGVNLIGKDWSTGQIHFDLYNQKDAWQLDWIIDYARTKNINVMLCLFDQNAWGDGDISNPYNCWSQMNPFNPAVNPASTCTTPYEFFNINNASTLTRAKNLVRFIVSRWGYAPNLVAWELWNEFDQIEGKNPTIPAPPSFTPTGDILNWHLTMYNYINSIDAFGHLITTSGGGDASTSALYSALDMSQVHDYKWPLPGDDFQNHFYQRKLDADNYVQPAKPHLVGEWGFVSSSTMRNDDPNGFELHNILWSTAFSTACGSATMWYWNDYMEAKNLYHLLKPVSTFMNNLPIPDVSFQPKKIDDGVIRMYYMENANAEIMYGWIQDKRYNFPTLRASSFNTYLQTLNPTDKPQPLMGAHSISIPIPSLQNNKEFIVEWYNSETGLLYQTQTVNSSNNSVVLNLPAVFYSGTFEDVVFKLSLNCNKYLWKEGILNATVPQNVSGNVVCSKNTGQVFYKTSDGKIQSMWWNSVLNKWEWSALNNAANNVAGDLCINEYGTHIYYRTVDSRINSIWWDNSISNWQWSDLNQASGNIVRGPLAVKPDGTEVFFRTTSNGLKSIKWNGAPANNWTQTNLNNAATSNVGDDIEYGGTYNQLFYKTATGTINNIWWDGSINNWQWSNLNGAIPNTVGGNLAVAPNGQVFYKNVFGQLNSAYWAGSTWAWSGLDGAATDVNWDIIAPSTGRVFYRNTSNNIYSITYNGTGWVKDFLDYATPGNVLVGNLAADNYSNVFFRGSDDRIHRIYYRSQCHYLPSTDFLRIAGNQDSQTETNETTESKTGSKILIMPNPNTGVFKVTLNNLDAKSLELYDVMGKTVWKSDKLEGMEIEIDIQELPQGVYFVKLEDHSGRIHATRLIKY